MVVGYMNIIIYVNRHILLKSSGSIATTYLSLVYQNYYKFSFLGKKPKTCKEVLLSVNRNFRGVFIPKCKDDGTYEDKQCLGSTGYCWCVNPTTGDEIRGTRKGPGQGEVNCGK